MTFFQWGGASGTDLIALTDATNLNWQFTYLPNGSGRLTSIIDPANRVLKQITYNQYGQPATITVPAAVSANSVANTATLTYDSVTGDLNQVTDSAGSSPWVAGEWNLATHSVVPGSAYDVLGDLRAFTIFADSNNPATATQPLTTRIEYDATQTPRRIVSPSGVTAEPQFTNNVPTGIILKDPFANPLVNISWQRDSRGRVYNTSDTMGSIFGLRYDKASNPTIFLDGNSNQTRFTYGPNNELTQTQWPGGATSSVLYDKAGRVRQVTEERGKQFTMAYDKVNRLTGVASVDDPTKDRTILYDAAGRILSITAQNGDKIQYQYHPVDKRLQSTTTTTGGYSYTISYTFAGDGTLTAMTSPVGTTNYTYDNRGNLSAVQNPFGETTTWTYDAVGTVRSQVAKNTSGGTATRVDYQYGNTGQVSDTSTLPIFLKVMEVKAGTASLCTYNLTRSFTGQVTAQSAIAYLASGINGVHSTDSFAYDARGRLTGINLVGTTTSSHSTNGTLTSTRAVTYQYNNSNNLFGTGWAANSNNQITSAPSQDTLWGMTGLAYDVAGNLTQGNGRTLTWDNFGDLQSVHKPLESALFGSRPAWTITYGYDIVRRRAVRYVDGVAKKRYLYDGMLLIAEQDVATGQITHAYTWGQSGLVSDRIPDTTGNVLTQSRFYVFNPSGSTEFLISGTGTVLWGQGRWSPYGQYLNAVPEPPPGVIYTRAASPGEIDPPPTPFAFKGQWGAYTDERTGLIRMGVRDYAPTLGRFISRDPSGYAGGVIVYAYCIGDPINFYDPDGECLNIIIGAGIGAAVGGATDGFIAYLGGARGSELGWAIARGAGKGAISGALTGALGPAAGACTSWGMAAGVGAASGMIENIIEQGYNVYDGKQDNFSWKSFFTDGAIGAATGGLMKWLGQLCFDSETPVQVPSKKAVQVATNKPTGSITSETVAIKTIKAGDEVFARDEKTGKTVIARVKEVFKRTSDHWITVELASSRGGEVVETLKTTRQHPFYVDGKAGCW